MISLLGSTGCQPVVVGSLPTTLQRCNSVGVNGSKSFSAGCRIEQAGSLCSSELNSGVDVVELLLRIDVKSHNVARF
jgi:hypothetical protein